MVNVLVACLSGVLVLLAWVGWRFFIAPLPSAGMAASDASALNPVAALPAARSAGLVDQRQSKLAGSRRFNWAAHWWICLAPLLAGATVVGVMALSGRISLDPLQALDFQRQQHIQSALNPEKLVPPPLLPPSTFLNTGRPGLETADRDWGRLHPEFVQVVLRVFGRMEARGYPLALLEGYRSAERQDMLAGLGPTVTNARGFESKHQYGLAIDVAPLRDGKLVISERDPWAMQAYQALGEEAEKAGLVWGGRWTLKDYGHIEVAGTISAILKKK